MSDPADDTGITDNHRRVLQAGFAHVDSLLGEIEAALLGATTLFPRFVADLSEAQQRVVRDHVADVRRQVQDALRALRVPVPEANVKLTRALQARLTLALITLAELDPVHLRGYGELSSPDRVEAALAPCARSLRRLAAFAFGGAAQDLEQRVQSVGATAAFDPALRTLTRIVTEHGLVEFRGALQALIEQLESGTYEIAVFGRVSCGKSSLLNSALGAPLLPVGVTPVTALATRIVWGATPGARIARADGREESIDIERLGDFVTESANPDNAKGVSRVTVTVPSERLRAGMALVDTPGVSSLARSGAREAYAYLPRCDLGVLLIDAASAPAPQDFDLLRLFRDSGIEALIAVSKADLLTDGERARTRDYLRASLQRELGGSVPIHFVSTVGPHADLVRAFFDEAIEPRCHKAHDLARASAARKLAALRAGVAAALRTAIRVREGQQAGAAGHEAPDLRLLALEAEGVLRDVRKSCREQAELLRYAPALVLGYAAADLVSQRNSGRRAVAATDLLRRAVSRAAEDVRGPMRTDLLAAQARLRKILARMVTPLPFLAASPDEIGIDFVTQPGVEWPAGLTGVSLTWPWWLGFSSAALRRHLTGQLRHHAGAELAAAFDAAARSLRDWADEALARLERQFDSQAEPIRAHYRRLSQAAASLPDAQTLRADLKALEAT